LTKPSLPDAEALLAALTAQMRPHVTPQTGLIGIVTGGLWLAERLHRDLQLEVPHGSLDVSFYRDDFQHKGLKRKVAPSDIPFEVEGRDLILVDDVLYTGRTIRAAMNGLFDLGRPRRVRLCVLIDRGHRELPVEASFVGRSIQTSDTEIVEVRLQEIDGEERVMLVDRVS
jgi:pyrimidine operon attenuation protein / uracil phosphoribosyltransferase